MWPGLVACGNLVLHPVMEPMPPAVEVLSRNHWTTKEVPQSPVTNLLIHLLILGLP